MHLHTDFFHRKVSFIVKAKPIKVTIFPLTRSVAALQKQLKYTNLPSKFCVSYIFTTYFPMCNNAAKTLKSLSSTERH